MARKGLAQLVGRRPARIPVGPPRRWSEASKVSHHLRVAAPVSGGRSPFPQRRIARSASSRVAGIAAGGLVRRPDRRTTGRSALHPRESQAVDF